MIVLILKSGETSSMEGARRVEVLENYLKRVNVEALHDKVEELEIQIFPNTKS